MTLSKIKSALEQATENIDAAIAFLDALLKGEGEELETLRELADKATPGPWQLFEHGCPTTNAEADAAFIAASREAVPMLLDRITVLTEQVKEARAAGFKRCKEMAFAAADNEFESIDGTYAGRVRMIIVSRMRGLTDDGGTHD